ncbi:MAG: hypothetical protein ACK56I_27800, partial [bacterium]
MRTALGPPRRRAVLQPHLGRQRRRRAAEPWPERCQPLQGRPHRRAVQQRMLQGFQLPSVGSPVGGISFAAAPAAKLAGGHGDRGRRAARRIAAARHVGQALAVVGEEDHLGGATGQRRMQQLPREHAQLAREA